MGNFNRGGFRNNNRSDRPQMFKATCAECGNSCEVPFKPTGSKPVFCSNCFGKKEGAGAGRFESRGSSRFSSDDKPMFKAVCDSCHTSCEVPFRPNGEKPVYCKDCFGKSEKGSSSHSAKPDQFNKQFETLSAKLDEIIKLLSPKEVKPSSAKATEGKTKKVVAKKVTIKKTAAKKTAAKKKK